MANIPPNQVKNLFTDLSEWSFFLFASSIGKNSLSEIFLEQTQGTFSQFFDGKSFFQKKEFTELSTKDLQKIVFTHNWIKNVFKEVYKPLDKNPLENTFSKELNLQDQTVKPLEKAQDFFNQSINLEKKTFFLPNFRARLEKEPARPPTLFRSEKPKNPELQKRENQPQAKLSIDLASFRALRDFSRLSIPLNRWINSKNLEPEILQILRTSLEKSHFQSASLEEKKEFLEVFEKAIQNIQKEAKTPFLEKLLGDLPQENSLKNLLQSLPKILHENPEIIGKSIKETMGALQTKTSTLVNAEQKTALAAYQPFSHLSSRRKKRKKTLEEALQEKDSSEKDLCDQKNN